jgi:hypothetical protein
MKKTSTARKVWLETHQHWVHFVHRDTMRRKTRYAKAKLPAADAAVPATTLPVDCTGNATVSCPMDGNDTLGDCGPVMCAHTNTIRTYGQGKAGFTPVLANVAALEAQYEQVSGGDNGTDEDMLVGTGGIWLAGIAGDSTQTVVDHLDVDVTDAPLAQYCVDQFYAIAMAWSVPDDFLQKFTTGTVWANADTPDPNNGHYTPLADVAGQASITGVNGDGFYRLWTWGTWCWVSPAFVASVDPDCFVTFSALQFAKATGYDSHGRHVSDQAAKWVALGGNASKVATVVAQFPPKAGPTPSPVPAPTPPVPAPPAPTPAPGAPTLAEAQAAVVRALQAAHPIITRTQAESVASTALAGLWKTP